MRAIGTAWHALGPWGRAFIRAAAALVVIHLFLLRTVQVRSTSMYATLLPGDVLLVQRWPVWTGLDRGDIIVFRDPLEDDRPMHRRRLLVKRAVGLPGDTLRIAQGMLRVNGTDLGPFPGETKRWLLRVDADTDLSRLLATVQLTPQETVIQGVHVELPLNDSLAALLEHADGVRTLAPLSLSLRPQRHLFPYHPGREWSSDRYGPLVVPARGGTAPLTVEDLPMIDRIITRYENHRLEVSRGKVELDGAPASTYLFKQDHLFVLGDARHNSADSRHWGFVPMDHVVGRVSRVFFSRTPGNPGLRWSRTLRPIQ